MTGALSGQFSTALQPTGHGTGTARGPEIGQANVLGKSKMTLGTIPNLTTFTGQMFGNTGPLPGSKETLGSTLQL